jgi:flagellar hook-basal body complex protein FliE
MPLKISSIVPADPAQVQPLAAATPPDSSFHDVLSSAIQQVEGSRSEATQSVERFLSGEGEDLHSTILASQRADLEFQMFMQVRNKIVSAYQEIMKMQV